MSDESLILNAQLKELHLPAMRENFSDFANNALKESLSYEKYLLELTEVECATRKDRRIKKFFKESKLPLEKSLANFDMERLPSNIRLQFKSLLDGSFLKGSENILAFGNSGSGKTHLLCALAAELIQQGHRVYFSPCSLLVQELLSAKKELKLSRALKRLSKYDVILIDDIGYVQQSREEMEVLFTLLADRYERGSLMITSNLPFSKWESIFKDPMTTAAAIDRLVHHSVILELNIPSYRIEQAKKNTKKKKAKGV
jgi:DNA replication protein DnaC